MRPTRLLLTLSLTACAGKLAVQAADPVRGFPAVRSLGHAEASLKLGMHSQPSVRVLSDGRALATDLESRRLVLASADLESLDTLFDATTPAPLTYPPGFAQVVAGLGDTTLFFDSNARGYRVIDPSGRVVRRLSLAEGAVIRSLQSPSANALVDSRGRLVLKAQRNMFDRPAMGMQPQAESLMLARVVFDRPGWDSLAAVMGTGQRLVLSGDSTLRPRAATVTIPLVPVGDAWTVTSDGSIAIVRSGDFHVDWIAPDGTRRSSPPVPWPWRNYTQSERDSIRSAGTPMIRVGSARVMSGDGAMRTTPPPFTTVIDTLPTRVPAFNSSGVIGDREGRVWLMLGSRVMGPGSGDPAVYAVLDATGQIVDRVELPARRVIVGFGRSEEVFAVAPSMTPDGYILERYRYQRLR